MNHVDYDSRHAAGRPVNARPDHAEAEAAEPLCSQCGTGLTWRQWSTARLCADCITRAAEAGARRGEAIREAARHAGRLQALAEAVDMAREAAAEAAAIAREAADDAAIDAEAMRK